jgi:ABC-type molybdate transport system substrate-binding protein
MNDFINSCTKDYPDIEINLTCKGSTALVNDILAGVPVDILISADVGLIDNRLIPSNYTGWDGELLHQQHGDSLP